MRRLMTCLGAVGLSAAVGLALVFPVSAMAAKHKRKPPKLTTAIAQQAAQAAAPYLTYIGYTETCADPACPPGLGYTKTFDPGQVARVYPCSAALRIKPAQFGCQALFLQTTHSQPPQLTDGTPMSCDRLVVGGVAEAARGGLLRGPGASPPNLPPLKYDMPFASPGITYSYSIPGLTTDPSFSPPHRTGLDIRVKKRWHVEVGQYGDPRPPPGTCSNSLGFNTGAGGP